MVVVMARLRPGKARTTPNPSVERGVEREVPTSETGVTGRMFLGEGKPVFKNVAPIGQPLSKGRLHIQEYLGSKNWPWWL